jgi:tripartite-type tricarboxylate transporter receptor subunit TctC
MVSDRSRLHWPRRRALAGLVGLAGLGASARSRSASRSGGVMRLTVAYPPGGVSDETARDLAQRLAARWGLPVLVDHRPGAGGAVAMEALARAHGDTQLLCFSAITPLLPRPHAEALRYDPVHDIAPVAAVMSTPLLVIATPAFKGRSFADLVAAARREPGRIRWATSGHGTTGHLVLEQVCAVAGVEITHVPYAGGGQQLTDALAGQFEVLSSNVAARQLADVRSGRLRALAVGAPHRLPVLPEVPTLVELGFAAANLWSLFGLFAPAGLPAARLDQLNLDIRAVASEPAFRQRLIANGNLPADGPRADFIRDIASEAAAMQRLLAAPGASAAAPGR